MKVAAQLHCGDSAQVFTATGASRPDLALWAGKGNKGGILAQVLFGKADETGEKAFPFSLTQTSALVLPSAAKAISVNKKLGIVAVGGFDGSLTLVDEEGLKNRAATNHSEMIHCVDFTTPRIFTGSSKGSISIWDPREMKKPMLNFVCEASLPPECWCLASSENCIIGGYSDGIVRVFDIRRENSDIMQGNPKFLNSVKLPSGVCSIDSLDGLTFSSSTQSGTISILAFNSAGVLTIQTNREKAHQGTSWAVKYLDSKHIISSGSAGDLKLWELSASGRPPMPHISSFPSQQSLLSIDVINKDNPSLCLVSGLDNTIRVISILK